MVKVSVIIPVYNDEEYLVDCIESVVKQTLKPIEIICVNDGSTDKTPDILKEYADKYSNIKVLEQLNRGVSYARNRGLDIAEGEFVAFMDGDDIYPSADVLECLYDSAKREKVNVCGGEIVNKRTDEIKITPDFFQTKKEVMSGKRLLFEEYGSVYRFTRFIYLREMIKNYNIRFPEVNVWEDPIFLSQVMVYENEMYFIDKEVYFRRMGIHIRKYSYENVLGVLEAAKYILELTKQKELPKIQENFIKSFVGVFKTQVIPYYLDENELYSKFLDTIHEQVLDEAKLFCEKELELLSINGMKIYLQEVLHEMNMLQERIRKHDNFIVYGAGVVGNYVIKMIYDYWNKIPSAIAVTNLIGNDAQIMGIKLTEVNQLVDNTNENLFVVAAKGKNQKDMVQYLKDSGIETIYAIDFEKFQSYFRMLECGRYKLGD